MIYFKLKKSFDFNFIWIGSWHYFANTNSFLQKYLTVQPGYLLENDIVMEKYIYNTS